MTTLTTFFKTDNVDDHVANDVNELIAAALRAEFANTETITATKELTDNDCQFQYITASGADRTVELASEATTNHVQAIYNSGATYNVVVKDDSGTYTFATLAPDEYAVFLPFNAEGWRRWAQPEEKYKLSVTVSANDLIVALKHLDSTDPTPTRPLCIVIAGVKRNITAATSITLADATNWFNAGGAELATKEIDYFAYAVWDSNSSIVAVSCARIPHGRLVSDFSSTSTNEKYLGNYANFTSTDDVALLGRFAATLSAGAGYTWTVPTFTSSNLIHVPTFETRWLDWVPTITGYSANPTSTIYRYQVVGKNVFCEIRELTAGTSNSTSLTLSAPFTALTLTNGIWLGIAAATDNGSALTTMSRITIASASNSIVANPNASGVSTWTAANGKQIGIGNIRYPLAS